jgi:carboxymethylenebutenolidase
MSDEFVKLINKTGAKFDAFFAVPKKPNGGAIVILQEIFGINENIRSVSKDFAADGFLTIAPDLYWRQEPCVDLNPASQSDRERAMSLMKGLDLQLAIEDALVAARYLAEQPDSDGKVGCVGYCLGGKLAYLLSTQPEISCVVSYYGTGIQGALDVVPKVSAATLLHIAEADHLCPPSAQSEILRAIEQQPRISAMVHPGVGHAFARRGSASYDEASANRANAATLLLLQKELVS